MSDFSDYHVLGISDEFFEGLSSQYDSDDLGNSSDDEDPKVIGIKAIKLARSNLAKERRGHLGKVFRFLQEVILDGKPPQQKWKRSTIVVLALNILQELKKNENALLIEFENQLQGYFTLKRRLNYIKRKKLKPARLPLTRRLSSIPNTPPQPCTLEKRSISMDDSRITVSEPLVSLTSVEANKLSSKVLKPRKSFKTFSSLTEEEKEYYNLHEKIEDLLVEVDSIWEDVKDEEEVHDDDDVLKDDKNIHSKLHFYLKSVPPCISTAKPQRENQNVTKSIAVTNINKLMDPQFVRNSDSYSNESLIPSKEVKPVNLNPPGFSNLKNQITSEEMAIDSSDDENKLVIDDTPAPPTPPPPRESDELNLLEALQAVDNLCREIIPDVDEPDFIVKAGSSNRPVRKTRNLSGIPDIIVLD